MRVLLSLFCLLLLTACAQFAPVPGGDNRVNTDHFAGPEDLITKLNQLEKGMTDMHVFELIGISVNDVTRMQRSEVVEALYSTSSFAGTEDPDRTQWFLHSLYGYSFKYTNLEKEHGFSTPIRLRTMEEGNDYRVVLVFQGGRLFEKPILTGGPVKRSSSQTFFDILSPSVALDAVR